MFSNSSGLKSVFEKVRFHDGLVWTISLTIEIKLRFQILNRLDERNLKLHSPKGACNFEKIFK